MRKRNETMDYRKYPCYRTETAGMVFKAWGKKKKLNVRKIFIVDYGCDGDEGFGPEFNGFHRLKVTDMTGETVYIEKRKDEQFIVEQKGDVAIVIWYPDTEARGSSYSAAMKNAQEIHRLQRLGLVKKKERIFEPGSPDDIYEVWKYDSLEDFWDEYKDSGEFDHYEAEMVFCDMFDPDE